MRPDGAKALRSALKVEANALAGALERTASGLVLASVPLARHPL